MNKKTIVSLVVVAFIIIGLFIFAGTHKYEDSYLRKEGVRVKIDEYALIVDTCDEGSDYATCTKTVDVNGKQAKFVFEYINFNKEGYPSTLVASINGKEFLRKTGINLEGEQVVDNQFFLNFNVIDDVITFTYTDGVMGLNTTLYAVDLEGNIILQDHDLADDGTVIKDYVEFLTFKDGTISVLATRMDDSTNFKGESVCKAKANEIVESTYAYTYKDKKFTKRQTSKTTAEQFIKDNKVKCED